MFRVAKYLFSVGLVSLANSSFGGVVTTAFDTSVLYSVGSVSGLIPLSGEHVRVELNYESGVYPVLDNTINSARFIDFSPQSEIKILIAGAIFHSEIVQISQTRNSQLGPFQDVDFSYSESGPIDYGAGMYRSLELFFFSPGSTMYAEYGDTNTLLTSRLTSVAPYYFGRVSECGWSTGCNEIVFGIANPLTGEISAVSEPNSLVLAALAALGLFGVPRCRRKLFAASRELA